VERDPECQVTNIYLCIYSLRPYQIFFYL
jgi:hypothetical protein